MSPPEYRTGQTPETRRRRIAFHVLRAAPCRSSGATHAKRDREALHQRRIWMGALPRTFPTENFPNHVAAVPVRDHRGVRVGPGPRSRDRCRAAEAADRLGSTRPATTPRLRDRTQVAVAHDSFQSPEVIGDEPSAFRARVLFARPCIFFTLTIFPY